MVYRAEGISHCRRQYIVAHHDAPIRVGANNAATVVFTGGVPPRLRRVAKPDEESRRSRCSQRIALIASASDESLCEHIKPTPSLLIRHSASLRDTFPAGEGKGASLCEQCGFLVCSRTHSLCVILRSATKRDEESRRAQEARGVVCTRQTPWQSVTYCFERVSANIPRKRLCCRLRDPHGRLCCRSQDDT